MADGGWNTIESDAGVFTFLIEELGVKGVQFEELLSLETEALEQISPLYGLIFLFKFPVLAPRKDYHSPSEGTFDYASADNLFFAAQTIQNACGTQALLSVLLNNTSTISLGPQLTEFREFAMGLPSDLRGEVLSNSEHIRTVHNTFARSSPFLMTQQTAKDPRDAEDVFHFIAYVPVNGALYELDGLQPAPIRHCALPDTDSPARSFAEAVIPVIQKRIERYPPGEIHFNLLAVCRDLRLKAQDFGDGEMLAREQAKRQDWRWENALRRHNFVGFSAELLKGVVRAKLREGGDGSDAAYDHWVNSAVEQTRKRQDTKLQEREARKMEGKAGGADDGDQTMDG